MVVKQFQDGGRFSSDFHEILYTAAYFELDERHVIKNEKVALDRLRVRQNVFLVYKQHSRQLQFNADRLSSGVLQITSATATPFVSEGTRGLY